MLAKLILLAALYTSQFIPTTFFIQTVPVFMRQQNMSLDAIGFLSFLILPSALKKAAMLEADDRRQLRWGFRPHLIEDRQIRDYGA